MVTTRRSSRGEQENPSVSSQEHKRQKYLAAQATGIRRLGRDTVECFSVLERVFLHATPGLWFRILPLDDSDDDICVGFGVEWRYLLPLLTKCGLVRSVVTSMVKDIEVVTRQWDEMAKALVQAVRMEITSTRRQYASRPSHFICVGTPKFRNPMDQEKAFQSLKNAGKISSLPSTTPPRPLMIEVKAVAMAILNDRLADRAIHNDRSANRAQMQQQEQQHEQLDDEQIEEVANVVNDAIEYASVLDLNRRPRHSRSQAGEFFFTTTTLIFCLSAF